MWDIVLDAFLDTVKVFPFLLLIYVLIEILEHRTSLTRNQKILQGNLAPLIGSATGIIPQCGFSVMAAKLYDRGFIRTGTLMAVFIATSDEAMIIMLANASSASMVVPLVLIKLLIAVCTGYLVNFLLSGEKLAEAQLIGETSAHGCHTGDDCIADGKEKSDWFVYLLSPLLHALKITLYLLIVNLALGFVMYYAEDAINGAMQVGGIYWQPLLTAFIGLIPNCASSVILTSAYTGGGILFGSFVGGLCSNAGLGLVVLYKNGKKIKRNLLLTACLYVIAVAAGVAVNAVMAVAGLG